MIAKRILATAIDLSCSALPFAILGPLALLVSESSAPGALIAQAALLLAAIGSLLLFSAFNLLRGVLQAPTPGQKIAGIEFSPGRGKALIRVFTGALFLLPGLLFSTWSLLLLYPAWLCLTGRSPAELLSSSQMLASAKKI